MKGDLDISVAWISLCLYFLLFACSLYFYMKLSKFNASNSPTLRAATLGPRARFEKEMNKSKQIFFCLIAISALFDMPYYLGCIVDSGPKDCEWDNDSFTIVWSVHLIASTGYAIAMGIPLFLWSDIVNGRDGAIWGSIFRPDFAKLYLYISTSTYTLIQLLSVVVIALFFDPEENSQFENASMFYDATTIAEAVSITAIAFGWLLCGIRLQCHLKKVSLHADAERRALVLVNIIMVIVTISFLARGLLICTLVPQFQFELDIPNDYYLLWTFGTRWLPYVYNSFLLIYILRRSDGANQISNASNQSSNPLLDGDGASKVISTSSCQQSSESDCNEHISILSGSNGNLSSDNDGSMRSWTSSQSWLSRWSRESFTVNEEGQYLNRSHETF